MRKYKWGSLAGGRNQGGPFRWGRGPRGGQGPFGTLRSCRWVSAGAGHDVMQFVFRKLTPGAGDGERGRLRGQSGLV